MTYEIINNIPMQTVFDTLRVPYSRTSAHLHIIVDGVPTDGWMAYITGNYVVDFSGLGRASGPPFSFVKQYLQYNNKETFDWFNKTFGLGITYIPNQAHEKQKYTKNRTQKTVYFNNW